MKTKLHLIFTILFILVIVLSSLNLSAQSSGISYQAIVRDQDNKLVSNTDVYIEISILRGAHDGQAVYSESQTITSNLNGLITMVIGQGNVNTGNFMDIAWGTESFFIKTNIYPEGKGGYTITGTTQILSVPLALHAKKADELTKPIEEYDPIFSSWDKSSGISINESQISDLNHFSTTDETDPIFQNSVAEGISATDIELWNNKLDSDSEADPKFTAWDKTSGIIINENQISDLQHFTTADETDPIFNASVAQGITATDIVTWNNKLDLDSEADPIFSAWNKSTGINIKESQISDLHHFTYADERDLYFQASPAHDISSSDIQNWNNKLSTYTETDPVYSSWDKSTGISITESQISDLDHFTSADETDPVFSASVAEGISAADTTSWNNKLDSYTETDPVYSSWDKSTGISITESQVSDLDHFTSADETDPVFSASVAEGISAADTTSWNNKLDSYTETDPVYSSWDKSTGISITESQISDLDHFTSADETDPVFSASVAEGISAADTTSWNNKLDSYTETDPVYSVWDKSTGISITESQISDLDHFTSADETDPVFNVSVAKGISAADTTSWNNKLSSESQTLSDVLTKGNDAGGSSIVNVGKLGVGTNSITAGAAMEVNSTNGAFLLPRLTTSQRDAITPVAGMMIYNASTNKFQGVIGDESTIAEFFDSSFEGSLSLAGQSFTSTYTGSWDRLQIYAPSASSGTLTIYQGNGMGGSVLNTQSITLSAGFNDITLSSSLSVTTGQAYTFSTDIVLQYYPFGSYSGGTSYTSTIAFPGNLKFTAIHGMGAQWVDLH